jgi:hypothetical protein
MHYIMMINDVSQQLQELVLMMLVINKDVDVITVWIRERNTLFFSQFTQ